jgi:hypothetical protein
MAEIAPIGPGGANRPFLIIVVGLALVLLVGLIGVGALFLVPSLLGQRSAAASTTGTPTRVLIAAATATNAIPAATSTSVLVALATTDTPVATASPTAEPPTATSTELPTSTLQPTAAAATATPTTDTSLPSSGLGDDLVVLAIGLILVLVMFVARRARTSS